MHAFNYSNLKTDVMITTTTTTLMMTAAAAITTITFVFFV